MKFKVWDKRNERMIEWIDLDFSKDNGEDFITVFEPTGVVRGAIISPILLQSTGLLDKNGTEIFEGDIVKNEINEVGYIEWSKCRFNFCDSVGHFYLFSIGARQPFEILGNIYEHPHLLGED
ncbi:YopX family protein [Mammaliicoccus sciuri]|uniref:YopX family protein n=1 Tax=Mammaliicoccus sciuri TaxID=1296 RepID=UPI0019522748|nr:YopX family protein [Mammaliicoccus sciuri]